MENLFDRTRLFFFLLAPVGLRNGRHVAKAYDKNDRREDGQVRA